MSLYLKRAVFWSCSFITVSSRDVMGQSNEKIGSLLSGLCGSQGNGPCYGPTSFSDDEFSLRPAMFRGHRVLSVQTVPGMVCRKETPENDELPSGVHRRRDPPVVFAHPGPCILFVPFQTGVHTSKPRPWKSICLRPGRTGSSVLRPFRSVIVRSGYKPCLSCGRFQCH